MNENIKLLLRAARINKGMSQKKAASLLGVHYQTLASWEKDSSDLSRSKMLLLEKVYGIPLKYIFFGNENEFIRTKGAD
ncbi:TPA: helix-turn-helix transcriptional regulator [Staphylococcus aureus]|uniref:Helix-turn-helix transcriptional regulator n=1 Tax=Staphylococcus aureus TaxID=1280 RepID=A0A517KFR5_STAAU|nr:helix-turn-helix transcriptional regulator [Staphylococcus aureus]MBU9770454.1 helix-turn-helix domain-containing protein [Staphylococcus aureus]MBU9793547.1 helix-turn-helix domain-containing protein [Staphylococcus aureus]MBY6735286.1 helix-turn-helix transcriptional regulator [Staphylococcus aureus]MDG6712222.1 helix-turn-helix transcriptional regulator [Staphylococcus aureus]NHN12533.1 helix-turn-helix transcriptional regulator [Staphylococcus aureus]